MTINISKPDSRLTSEEGDRTYTVDASIESDGISIYTTYRFESDEGYNQNNVMDEALKLIVNEFKTAQKSIPRT